MRFLGIDRRVEVGERSRDRAVTVTIKSALHAAMTGLGGSPAGDRPTFLEMGSNSWPVYRPVSGRHSSDIVPMSLRYPCGIRQGAGHDYRPYGGRTAICSVPVEWPAINGRDPAAVCQFGGEVYIEALL